MKDMQEVYEFRQCCILRLLSRSPRPRRFLEVEFVRKFQSPAAFEATFKLLIRKGRIIKSGPEHRAPYSITEHGRKALEVLS